MRAGSARVADASGRRSIEGAGQLARFMREAADIVVRPAAQSPVVRESARNRFPGLVTRVLRDSVMAQVEIQSGPHRVVSLMSREAADEWAWSQASWRWLDQVHERRGRDPGGGVTRRVGVVVLAAATLAACSWAAAGTSSGAAAGIPASSSASATGPIGCSRRPH